MRFLAMVILASLVTLAARAQDESLLVTPDPFAEAVRDGAEISGAALVGLLRHGATPHARRRTHPRTLRVEVPPDLGDATLCLRILTSNGLYEASGEYTLEGRGPDARLVYPTEHGAMLDGLAPGALAIRATAGACQSPPDPGAVTYATVWQDAEAAPVSMLVKAFGADEVFLLLQGRAPIRCRALDTGGVSAADHACDLPDDLTGAPAPELIALTDGIPSRPVPMPIWLRGR